MYQVYIMDHIKIIYNTIIIVIYYIIVGFVTHIEYVTSDIFKQDQT